MQNYMNVKKDFVWAFVLFLNLIIYFLYLKTGSHIFLGLYFASGFSLFFIFFQEKINIKILIIFMLMVAFFSIFGLMSQEFPFYINLYNELYGIVAFISAYILFLNKYSVSLVKLIFSLYASFVFYHVYKLGFNDPDLYNNLLEGSSRNYLSAIFILLLVLLILVHEKNKEKLSIIYPLVNFLGCVALFGRSGIVFSLLILLYFSYKKFGLKIFLLILTAILGMVFYKLNIIENIFLEKTNFVNGVSSERTIFLSEYLANITYKPYDLFFGRRLQSCCEWILLFNSNPHNSFIMGHIRYGIFHTLFSIGILIYILLSRNLTYIFLGFVVLSRFFVDQLGLFTAFDIVLFFLLLLIFSSQQKKQ
ncbi:hypothetical protein MCL26_17290 [Acinetobacter pittii]|uniref:hypothetical protein n=1 Tax=Acinetobacter pittii TaxID=48296 RepID=UPI001EFDC9B4|nr:hypothetical protein [Acinetobacter pittii]MCG9516854.1 hypothetical protein [Acinetobacter pittii]